jgi:hypothetical protein
MSTSPRFRTASHKPLLLLMTAAMLTVASIAIAGDSPAWTETHRGNTSDIERGHNGHLGGPKPIADDDKPTRPVPEPGTMSLVAMGVIAIAASVRKIRSH